MKTKFYKYQGTGNDFVIVDNRLADIQSDSAEMFAHWCDRRFGIGADGVILLEKHPNYDFEMKYFNANGKEGSMCGNGGRCIVHFAHSLGILKKEQILFMAVDGLHEAKINKDWIHLKMGTVSDFIKIGADYDMDTGSPHYVQFVDSLQQTNVWEKGRSIRHSPAYDEKGINVNFAEIINEHSLQIGTFERGVEDVTFSCGTGVTACSIALADKLDFAPGDYEISCKTDGGDLKVKLTKEEGGLYKDLWLIGPAACSFEGEI